MKVLVLKTVRPDFTAHGGFIWPKSGRVECPDWNPEPICGGGLHGLLWGEGDYILLNHAPEAKWLVLEVDSEKIVDLRGKVKFPYCNVIYAGERDIAIEKIVERNSGAECFYAKKTVGWAKTAIVGAYGTAIAGNSGKAIAGRYGKATAGDGGLAIVGIGGRAQAGNSGRAIIENYGEAIVGNNGEIMAGSYGKAIAGHCGKVTVGNGGTAIVGDYGVLEMGPKSYAMVGFLGKIKADYYDDGKIRTVIGYEGENIKVYIYYKVKDGKFIKVSEDEIKQRGQIFEHNLKTMREL